MVGSTLPALVALAFLGVQVCRLAGVLSERQSFSHKGSHTSLTFKTHCAPITLSAVADADLTLLAVTKLGNPRQAFAGKTVWIVGASQGIGQAVRTAHPHRP